MIDEETVQTSLFQKSDNKSNVKSQTMLTSQMADLLISKNRKYTSKREHKTSRIKQDENAVSKLLNKIKENKKKQIETSENEVKSSTYACEETFLVAEPIEIEFGPEISVEFIYNKDYGETMEESLYSAMVIYYITKKYLT